MKMITMFSFVIPTYKNNKSLLSCVKTLLSIGEKLSLKFEIIVVDNYSGREYIDVIKESIPDINVKIIKNPVIGAHHSRRLGLYNAIGDIIVFVDDDNYLTESYVQFIRDSYIQYGNKDLFIGCASQPFHEIDWIKHGFHPHSYACGSLTETTFKQNIPVYWGAGMCMSKNLADKAFRLDLTVDGRMDKKNYIMSGEDHEVSLRAYFLGAKFLYFDKVGLKHDFDRDRLNLMYYAKIQIGFVYAAWILKLYYLRNSKNIFMMNKVTGFIFMVILGILYFIRYPFKTESNLILFDVCDYPKYAKRFETVSAFI